MTAPVPSEVPRSESAPMGPPAGLAPTANQVRAARRNRATALAIWGIPIALLLTGLYWRLAIGTQPLGLGVITWVLPAAIAAVIAALMWALIVEPNSRGNALGDELRASAAIDAHAVARDEELVAQGKRLRDRGERSADVVEAELLEANERITDAVEAAHRAMQIASGVLGLGAVPAVRTENLAKPTMPHVDRIQNKVSAEMATQQTLVAQLDVQHMPPPAELSSPHVALTNPADVLPDTGNADPRGMPAFAMSTLTGLPAGPDGEADQQGPRRGWPLVLALLVAALVAAALVWLVLGSGASSLAASLPAASPTPEALVPAGPGSPVGLVEGVDYSFLERGHDGQVSRWGCDTPITVRLAGPVPAGAKEAVAEAVAALRQASGLPLVVGTPLSNAVTDPAQVPIGEIAYSYLTPEQVAAAHLELAGDMLGQGGFRTEAATGMATSGWVTIRADGAADPATVLGQEVVWHEGAHAVGLGHAQQESPHAEVMAPSTDGVGPLVWGPGDRYALAAVGCVHK